MIYTILEIVRRQFGDTVSVGLFGSRVDDKHLGGDNALLVEVHDPVEAVRFAAELQW